MHAVFKDARGRVLDGWTGVDVNEPDVWLPQTPEAVICEVYEHRNGARGALVVVFVRDAQTGVWSECSDGGTVRNGA